MNLQDIINAVKNVKNKEIKKGKYYVDTNDNCKLVKINKKEDAPPGMFVIDVEDKRKSKKDNEPKVKATKTPRKKKSTQ